MLIGELSERTGASKKSLRHYEEKGVISGERLENGYRDFDEAQVERVRAARFYLGLGISTDMIERIFECPGGDSLFEAGAQCPQLLDFYEEKREEINEQIEVLGEAGERLGERISLFEDRIEERREPSPADPFRNERKPGGNNHAIAR